MALMVAFSTSRPVFITGSAGTGKSYLLRSISDLWAKMGNNVAIVAPTGIAAINVGGSTIHRLFRLQTNRVLTEKPGSAHSPGNGGFPVGGFQKGHEPIIRAIDVLVIDEISMVRADILDAVDRKMRHSARVDEPFAGASVVYFGDLLQLPPIQDRPWKYYAASAGYHSPYPVDSFVFQEEPPILIELTHNVRVSRGQIAENSDDAKYVEILRRLRNLTITQQDVDFLNSNCVVSKPSAENLQIHTRNVEVDEENNRRLSLLPGEIWERTASTTGRFSDYLRDPDFDSFPADLTLKLKVGARVMCIKNDDQTGNQSWANGSLGTVKSFAEDGVVVRLDSGETHTIRRSRWDLIKYEVETTKNSKGEIISTLVPREEGTFYQYPLRLAWAATIHKSQGQTFDRITVSLGQGLWEPGQAYVALSRVTSLKGLELLRPLQLTDLIAPSRSVAEYMQSNAVSMTMSDLEIATRVFMEEAEAAFAAKPAEYKSRLELSDELERTSEKVRKHNKVSKEAMQLILENAGAVSTVVQKLITEDAVSAEDLAKVESLEDEFRSLFDSKSIEFQLLLGELEGEADTTIIQKVAALLFPKLVGVETEIIRKLHSGRLAGTSLEKLDYVGRRAKLKRIFSKSSVTEIGILLAGILTSS